MRRTMAHAGAMISLAIGASSCVKSCSDDSPLATFDARAITRVDVYALDEETRAFAGRERDVPFPALPDGASLRTPREHDAPLARFVATVTPPDGRRLLLGVRDVADSFVWTFLVVVPAAIGGEHVAHIEARRDGVFVTFDSQGRAALAEIARSGKRVAFAIDDRVVAAPVLRPDDESGVLVVLAKSGGDR